MKFIFWMIEIFDVNGPWWSMVFTVLCSTDGQNCLFWNRMYAV